MAIPQEKLAAAVSETSPLNDDQEYVEDYEEAAVNSCGGCGCFQGLCYGRRRGRYVLHQHQDHDQETVLRESWLKRRVKKLKEISEVVAGPKWKTFLRRFNKKRPSNKINFQYDPQSYKLNFDDGMDGELDGGGYIEFSARFAGPVVGISDPPGFRT